MTSYKAKLVTFIATLDTVHLDFRFFFKKWLELERRLGDEEGATVVKQKAVEWTQKAANSS
jgi:hypothetical protein